MKYISIVCFLLVAAATLEAAVQTQTITKKSGGSIYQIKFITTVDGKSYFVENDSAKTWAEASEYCNLFGMKLATITSPAQLTALKAAAGSNFIGLHWTAARDALETRQFVWDTTGQPLSPESTIYRSEYSESFQSCVCFASYVNNWYMSSLSCTTSWLYTLCET